MRKRYERIRKGGGGRPPRLDNEDLPATLAILEKLSIKWTRWVMAALPLLKKQKLSAKFLKELEQAKEAVDRVREMVGAKLQQNRDGR